VAFAARIQAENTSFRSADLSHADVFSATVSTSVFAEANLSGARMLGVVGRGCSFEGADLRGADFELAEMPGATFAGADLTGARFPEADLTDADFRGATLDGVDFSDAVLDGAQFDEGSRPQLAAKETEMDEP
jgi:uncharacterized protein YjbI with pentapeptide repeats